MATKQGYIKNYGGDKMLPQTTSTMVTDVAKEQALSATLADTPDYSTLGYPKFTTVDTWPEGSVVFHDNKLWISKGHEAGPWDADEFDPYSIEDVLGDVDSSMRVIAEALLELYYENKGLKAMLNDPTRRIDAVEYHSCGFPMMLSAAGAPNASVTPNEWNTETMGVWTGAPMVPGQEYFDTQNNKWYKAKMHISGATSDWLLLN